MKRLLFFFTFLVISLAAPAQKTLKIKGCIANMPYSKVYLGEIYGGHMTYIDSSLAVNGCFDFYVPDSIPTGLYNIVMNRQNNAFIRIIINKENIEFSTYYSHLLDSMNFTASHENTIFYNYIKSITKVSEKADLIKKLLPYYSETDATAKLLSNDLSRSETKSSGIATEVWQKYPKTFAAAYIKSQQPVKPPAGTDANAYLRQHLFDNVDFSNVSLLRSDLFTVAILNYISLYEKPTYTYREQVENYADALDHILTKTSANSVVYSYYRKELTDRYRYGNFDILGAYLMEYFKEAGPFAPQMAEGDVSIRINKLKNVFVGKKAPDILMPTYDGKNMNLSDISSDYTLLVFWSTNCPHCTEMLPDLKQVYQMKKGNSLEVLAISFDTDKQEWSDFIKKGNYGWLNYSDFKGWNSDIAKTYSIQGTPTFILLNKDKTVIYKPATLDELVLKLRSLNII